MPESTLLTGLLAAGIQAAGVVVLVYVVVALMGARPAAPLTNPADAGPPRRRSHGA